MREALVVMAKAPQVGSVKTRLHGALGPEVATRLYVCFLQDTLAALAAARAARPTIVSAVICYTPLGAEADFDAVGRNGATLLAQRGPDLGARLGHCFEDLFAADYDAVAVVNADSPTLPSDYLVAAFAAMEDEGRVVLGPSADGGYYLIGMRRCCPQLFEGISWSTGHVLAQTIATAERMGTEVALLPEWYDVDTPEELDRLRDEINRSEGGARFTREFFGGRS